MAGCVMPFLGYGGVAAQSGVILAGCHYDGDYLDFVSGAANWRNTGGVGTYSWSVKFGANATGLSYYDLLNATGMLNYVPMTSPNFTMEAWVMSNYYDYGAPTAVMAFQSPSFTLEVTAPAYEYPGLASGIRIVDNGVEHLSGELGMLSGGHMRVSYDGSVVRVFADGVLTVSFPHTRVAAITSGKLAMTGYYEEAIFVDELVLIQGAAVNNFTPWTRAYVAGDNPLLPQP